MSEGCERPPCLRVFSGLNGNPIPVHIRSFSRDATRGVGIGVRFRARSALANDTASSMQVCLFVPGWQDRSVACSQPHIAVTSEWETYSLSNWIPMGATWGDAALPPWFPSVASVQFRVGCARCRPADVMLDEVYMTQAAEITNASASWCNTSFAARMAVSLNRSNLGITPVASTLGFQLEIDSASGSGHPAPVLTGWTLRYRVRTPLGDCLANGTLSRRHLRPHTRAQHSSEDRLSFEVTLDPSIVGAVIFEYNATAAVGMRGGSDTASVGAGGDGQIVTDTGDYRLLVGAAIAPAPAREYDQRFRFSGTPAFYKHQLWYNGGRLDLRFARLSALGVNTQHAYANYAVLNNTGGRYGPASTPWVQLKWVRETMEAAARHGLFWLVTVDQHPGPGTPPMLTNKSGLQAWAALVGRTVEGAGQWVKWLEVVNEANTYLTGEQYLAVLRATSHVIRDADPSVRVLGPSVVCGSGRMEDCLDVWNAGNWVVARNMYVYESVQVCICAHVNFVFECFLFFP